MKLTFRALCQSLGMEAAVVGMPGAAALMDGQVNRVLIDSRQVSAGDVFFAFRGERVNGEMYAEGALAAGALAVVVSESFPVSDNPRILRVPDVQWALQELAKYYAATLAVPIIAISGSVGKTSTKDLMAHVLSQQVQVFKTKGNFNNELGLPLMLLELTEADQLAVLEMGMNHAGELARLVEIAKPQTAVLTNIGTAHIEFFGSRAGIFDAKMELASQLGAADYLIVNGLDDLLETVAQKSSEGQLPYRLLSVGRPGDAFWAEAIVVDARGTHFTLKSETLSHPVTLPLWGRHHVVNALLTLAVVERHGLSISEAIAALATAPGTPMRFERMVSGDKTWINDAYNASADSILAAVETLVAIAPDNNWVVLGDVFECGDQSDAIHRQIGEGLNAWPLAGAVFIGSAMAKAAEVYQGKKHYFESLPQALEQLTDILPGGACILVKASRGMKLEGVIQYFMERDTCTK